MKLRSSLQVGWKSNIQVEYSIVIETAVVYAGAAALNTVLLLLEFKGQNAGL